MPIARCAWLVPVLVAAMAGTAAAQAPTLPSDTLHAKFAPHFRLGPAPERGPAMPGDTLGGLPEPPHGIEKVLAQGIHAPLAKRTSCQHRSAAESLARCDLSAGRRSIGVRFWHARVPQADTIRYQFWRSAHQ